MFESRVLRRIFRPKRGEVTGEWRKLHSEELNDLYALPNIVRVIKSRACSAYGGWERRVQGFRWGNLRRKIPRRSWGDNIKMDL